MTELAAEYVVTAGLAALSVAALVVGQGTLYSIPTMHNPPIRSRLKAATHSRHALLDTLAGPIHSPAAYRVYLSGIAAFRCSAEQALHAAPWPEILDPWTPQSLTPLLMQDLADLSLPPPASIAMPPLHSTAATMGMLYVLEGSTLGARILVRQAADQGFTAAYGARHLAAQADSLPRWQAFVHRLAQLPLDSTDADHAAMQTFDSAILAMQAASALQARKQS